jgi:hypothetical protein
MTDDDDLESLLRMADDAADAPPSPSRDLAGRSRRLQESRTKRSRRLRTAAAFAGCYFAGMLTMHCVARPTEQTIDAPGVVSVDEQKRSTESIDPVPTERPEIGHRTQLPKFVPLSRYQLLRQLGDENVGRNDFEGAVALYSQALDAATSDEMRIQYGEDNVLLMSLKKDRIVQNSGTRGDSI